jgi:hypothetical protein
MYTRPPKQAGRAGSRYRASAVNARSQDDDDRDGDRGIERFPVGGAEPRPCIRQTCSAEADWILLFMLMRLQDVAEDDGEGRTPIVTTPAPVPPDLTVISSQGWR